MILGDDYGLAAVLAALAGLLGTVFSGIAAVYSARVHKQVSTNGDPRDIGEIASDVAKAVAPAQAAPAPNAAPAEPKAGADAAT